jgi:competence protein ComGC
MDIRSQFKIFLNKVRKENGATLVELLVAMSISVLVFGVITTALVQFMLVTRWGNSQLQISNDFQVASLWLGRDALESSSFTVGTGTEYGTLNWADSSHQFTYSYDLAENSLIREHLEDGVVQSTLTVARHIAVQSDVVFNLSGKLITVSIASTSGEEAETVNIQFALRTR